MSTALREGITRLEVTSRVTLAVLALASGVYTYLGVRELLNGNATVVFFAAVIYSVAVSVGIYAFWSFLMRLLPHVLDHVGRALLFGAMLLGSLMIIAMSAWLNATALAGAAALEQHLAMTLQSYSRDLDQANRYALAAQSLLPDIQMASQRFGQLAESEKTGTLTGTSGSGTVVQLLSQMSNQLNGLSQTVTQSNERTKALYAEGGRHLAKMRELVSSRGPIGPRSDAFGTESTALMGVIASLQQTSVAAAVKRAADDLAKGFIAPAAGGRTADLADRQTAVVGRVEAAVAAQSQALSAAADKVLAERPEEPAQFKPLSTAEAILRYAGDFIPSWAGAISIDLMPAVLVIILCVAHAAIRREGAPVATASTMTATELITAMRLAREVESAHEMLRQQPAATAEQPRTRSGDAAPQREPHLHEPEENVTPLALATARAGWKVTVALVPDSARARFSTWLHDRPDDSVLRWLFRLLLAVTAAVLVVDFIDLAGRVPEQAAALQTSAPSAAPDDSPDTTKAIPKRDGDERRGPLRQPDAELAAAMTFDLRADGRLIATGTITPGTAAAFAAEIDKRGGYVKTVVLHSPGGSVTDALDMGRLIRKNGFATAVEDGRYCASSCPLVFAGGVERHAGAKAAIGVHQVTAIGREGTTPADGMQRVQRVSAECQRYLRDMGVDALVWIHAMETPVEELFTFKPDELLTLKLATPRGVTPATASTDPQAKS